MLLFLRYHYYRYHYYTVTIIRYHYYETLVLSITTFPHAF